MNSVSGLYRPIGSRFSPSSPLFNPTILFITTVIPLAVVLALLYAGEKSLVLDESISVSIARLDWPDMWQVISHGEANMGLYYILLHFWLNLGESEFVIRSLSAIFAVLAVPTVFTLGSRLFNKHIGLIAALVLTVNPFFIHYAQEARGYSLLLFLVSLSTLLLVMIIKRPSKRLWVAYTFISVLAVYAHVFGALVLVAQAISLALLRRWEIPVRGLLFSWAATVLLVLPLAFSILTNSTHNLDWQASPGLTELFDVFLSFTQGAPLLAASFVLGCLALFWAMKQWLGSRSSIETWHYALILSWFFCPILIAFCISQVKPVFIAWYFIVCIPALAFLISIGVFRLPRMWLSVAGLVIILALSAVDSWYADYEKEDFRGVTAYVLSRTEPGDAIMFYSPVINTGFDYYLTRTSSPVHLPTLVPYYDPEKYEAMNPVYDIPADFSPGGEMPEPDDALALRLEEYGRVWLVLSHDNIVNTKVNRKAQSQMIQELLGLEYGTPEEKDFELIQVLLFTRP